VAVQRPGVILLSTCLGILAWGPLARPLFSPWFESWIQVDLSELGFRRELFSYLTGFIVLGLIPCALIHFRFKQSLKDYGLGLGDWRVGVWFTLVFVALTIVPFYLSAKSPAMWGQYPLVYQGLTAAQLKAQFSWPVFLRYELVYALFFFVIEFTFRGYLLFGLKPELGSLSVLVQMLPYITWHLAKPPSEVLPTPIWGFVVGAAAFRIGSIWYIFAAHWLLNVFMDTMILHLRGVF
jgi:hypothetical protein